MFVLKSFLSVYVLLVGLELMLYRKDNTGLEPRKITIKG